MIQRQCLCAHQIIYFVSKIWYNTTLYNWRSYIDIVIHISGILSSMFKSDLYGFIQRILYLVFVRPYYKFTVALVKHSVITNGTIYGI